MPDPLQALNHFFHALRPLNDLQSRLFLLISCVQKAHENIKSGAELLTHAGIGIASGAR